ncbi:hypothetical protein ENKNEFLB_04268 [Nocardioides aquaticus]|uniref:Uncharacterized protein n=2 Tax=Nocardioides aquaticus TaxID=160826 RepID=A0ABX8EMW4_9ACTN|nr:hypothetical protein [Nocardioides aquaticus]QVT81849.1 hypothetical protein ENKNEFLB_04268 [Nocardioides aquaticus]
MAKRKAYLHIGLPGVGDVLDTAVQRHRTNLAELDVLVPTKAREESFRAAIELRRRHKEWGYRRKEVEGAWAGIARRALKGRSTVLVSQAALAGAAEDEIDLLTTQLPGLKLHVVVTVAAPDGWAEPGDPDTDLASVLGRWRRAVREPDRLHVVVVPPGDAGRETAWRELGRVVGFGTRSLSLAGLEPGAAPALRPLDAAGTQRLRERAETWRTAVVDGGHDVRGDLADLLPAAPAPTPDLDGALLRTTRALAEARRDVERLSRRNETLEARLDEAGQVPRRRRFSVA